VNESKWLLARHLLPIAGVNRFRFKVDHAKGGFLRGTLAPVDRSHEPRFGVWDAIEVVALVVGVILVMRCLVR
jgi:hypothetical protein